MLSVEFTAQNSGETDRKTQKLTTYWSRASPGRTCAWSHFSCDRFFEPLRTVALQAPLSMGFSRQEDWSGWSCPPPGDLPDPGMELASLTSPASAGRFFTTSASCWNPKQSRVLGRKSWTNWQTDGRWLWEAKAPVGPHAAVTFNSGSSARALTVKTGENSPALLQEGEHQSSLF